MKHVSVLLVVLIALLIGPHLYKNYRIDAEIQQKINESVNDLPPSGYTALNRPGHVFAKGTLRAFTEKDLHRLIKQNPKSTGRVAVWRWNRVHTATLSAQGIDRRHHFANSYLVGYQPFETRRIWVPLHTLALRKHYEYDHLQYSGLKDVWQNSQQAYYYTRGDCEDHAMILADWLIEMGLDARVVLGTYKEYGHAWVVFILNGKTYLQEATSKRKTRSMRGIPTAALKVNYHPQFQFNRDSFWVNTGSRFTTAYTGRQWELRSRFVDTKAGPHKNPQSKF
ncbi:MAG: transglutaminase domain-containing protein [Desulfobacteraceae bacterium]|jgi:hypothetical protein